MRIDGPTEVRTWLFGKFSGSFKGNLIGTATSASRAVTASYALQAGTASYALFAERANSSSYSDRAASSSWASQASTASYVNVNNVDGLIAKLGSNYLPLTGGVITGSLEVTDQLIINNISYKGGIHSQGDIVLSGSVSEASPTGSSLRFYDTVRTQGAIISYDGEANVIQFLFYKASGGGDTGSDDSGSSDSGSDDSGSVPPSSSHVPGTDYTDPTTPSTNPWWRP